MNETVGVINMEVYVKCRSRFCFASKLCRYFPPFLAFRMKHAWFDSAIAKHSGDIECYAAPLYCNRRIRLNLTEVVDRSCAFVGSNNIYAMVVARCVLTSGDVVYEFGANLGTETLSLSGIVGASGKVVAIEANPVIAQSLEMRVRESGVTNIEIIRKAICMQQDPVGFFVGVASENSGRAHIVPDSRGDAARDVVMVPTIQGDSLLQAFPHPRFIHIDIEGAELSALESCRRILTEYRPVMVAEVCTDHLSRMHSSPHELYKYLLDCRYRMFDLGSRRLIEVDESRSKVPISTDWLCLPAEKVDRYRKLITRKLLLARIMPRFARLSPLCN